MTLYACFRFLALRESLSAKTNRCTALQEEVGRLRDKTGEAKVAQNAQSSADREELIVKERKIELFKEKVKSLQEQLNEKEKYICDLETKLKVKLALMLLHNNYVIFRINKLGCLVRMVVGSLLPHA